MNKLIVKPDWRIMRKRFILVCMIPFLVTALIGIACIFSRRPEIQAAPFELPLFGLVIDFFLIGLIYLIFISIRISFDGKKMIWYIYGCIEPNRLGSLFARTKQTRKSSMESRLRPLSYRCSKR